MAIFIFPFLSKNAILRFLAKSTPVPEEGANGSADIFRSKILTFFKIEIFNFLKR